MAKILIISKSLSPRLTYVCDFVFNETFRCAWEYAPGSSDDEIIIRGSADEITLSHAGILFENGIEQTTHARYHGVISALNATSLPFERLDVLGIIFYLISRYEEYCIDSRDEHDRFLAHTSCLHRSGQLTSPLVDRLLFELRKVLSSACAIDIPPFERKFKSTIDIDYPWYRKHLKFPYQIRKKRYAQDPYDQYDAIATWHEGLPKPILFWLCRGRRPYDVMQLYKQGAVRELFLALKADGNTMGIHPNYQSGFDALAMKQSHDYFEKLAGETPRLSRQHYLRMKLPLTYRLLLDQGIEADYSLGYAECIGFRAGTARAFLWYDLERETTTTLRIHPLAAMDVTMKKYMNLSPEEALSRLNKIWENMDQLGGQFILLWHNSSLSEVDDWEDYRAMYIQFLLKMKQSIS